jgi:hypothetical protein
MQCVLDVDIVTVAKQGSGCYLYIAVFVYMSPELELPG